jgi:hypothetical protein
VELCLVLGVTLIAYSPVLFNFFLGDDFVHLSWLAKCIHDPSLLLKNFYSSWLDVITTKFYRPLISLFMLTDYAVWKTNGFGFHLTNVLFHLANCFFVYRIAVELIGKLKLSAGKFLPSTAAIAALLFGLYPLHSEPVAWITGRVDTIVTTFYLGAIFTFIRWQVTSSLRFLVVSLAMMILALLSKEMAITIPAAVSLLAITRAVAERQPLLGIVRRVALQTASFWILLVIYFIVRRLALGTFVGGYDDSLFFIANWHSFLSGWLSGIKMTLLPTNREVMSAHNIFSIGWCISIFIALLGVGKGFFDRRSRATFLLLSGLIVLSIAPVYKIFAISPDLEGSRLVYLTSSFFCLVLAAGMANIIDATDWTNERAKFAKLLAPVAIAMLAVCAFIILWRNNLVWREAGLECSEIRAGLEHMAQTLPEDSHLLLLGLPDQKNGAYICRNASPGAIEPPQLSRALKDCIFLNTFDSVFPFGYLRRSLQDNKKAVKIFCWNSTRREFTPVELPPAETAAVDEKQGPKTFQPDDRNLVGWTTEFVLLSNQSTVPSAAADIATSQLTNTAKDVAVLSNSLTASVSGEPQIPGQTLKTTDRAGELFALRAIPLWACGAGGHIRLQNKDNGRKDFQIIQSSELMPELDFANSGYLGSKGFLHLDGAHDRVKLQCVHNDVPGADHFILEVMRANVFVDPTSEQNGVTAAKQMLKEIQGTGRIGSLEISKSDLQGHGLYQARLWSVDKTNHRIGVAGDHIIIDVGD